MLYETLTFNKQIREIKAGLLNTREWKTNEAGKVVMASVSGAWENPWIYFQKPRRKYCHYWWEIHSRRANLIPQFCRHNCWKCIVSFTTQPSEEFPNGRMGSVAELFGFMGFMQVLNLPSKIGLDIREYTYGLWKAYFYGETLEEAKKYYEVVKPILDENFQPGFSLVIQRGCTEMNAKLPSRLWGDPVPLAELELERRIDDMLEYQELNYDQAEWSIQETQENWISRAIQMGDPSARETAEEKTGNPEIWPRLVVHADHYHEVDPRGIPLEPGELTAEEMLLHFDNKMEAAGVLNKDMLEYMKELAGEGSDPMEVLDRVMENRDIVMLDAFIDDMQSWLKNREQTDVPPKEPSEDSERERGGEGGGE